MRKLCHFRGAPACIFSTILCTAYLPVARGSAIENLVFTEVSPTELTETLNGVAIGSWSSTGSYSYDNSSPFGDVSAQPVGPAGPGQYAWLEFMDPVNNGDVVFLSLFGVDGNTHGIVAGDINAFAAGNFAPPAIVYPFPPNQTSTLPFSLTDATVDTSEGSVAVNITFVGSTVPDGASTGGLLLIAGTALVIARRQCRVV